MLSIPGANVRCCDGPTRREFLRVGGATLFGLSLPHFLSWKALASANAASGIQRGKPFGNAKSVILLFLQGGPSHLDIWDPKPDAPSNIRGEFKPIKTKVDGIQVSETMPSACESDGQDYADPLAELYPCGVVQSHGGDLSNDDGLPARQGIPFRPAGTAVTSRLSPHGQPHRQDETAEGGDAAVC